MDAFFAPGSARAATVGTDIANLPPYGNGTLPPGIRSRPIANVNGLTVHILEAGYEVPGRPAVLLLLHGFPELAYSWRKVMLPLAAAEYHVIAPISGAMAAPLAGTTRTTPIPIPSASSTWSAMPWGLCSRSATARSRPWWGTTPARRLLPGAR